ncbi:NAD(P)-binding protein [Daedalea quercina L-15889]|uniref:NAD(P)-binding protein n=1 Tax=Daedalea quercina L-15889 TaxID=1314783 RepID=A0A165SZL6_9APHY|nr:NAD(P)-binding protein [Daedalea quercina L-15889]
MSFRPIKMGVVGVGFGGLTFHIPFILALSQHYILHAVVERNPSAPGGRIKERFGGDVAGRVKIYRTYEELVHDPEVELIVVTTPNHTHFEFAKQALEAGKNVLVDKPVTATAAEARVLGEIAKTKGLVLYPYQNCRFNADFLALRKLLELPAGHPQSLGTLVEFESRYDRYRTAIKGSWKDVPSPGTGLTYDLGSHLVDQALVLFGRPTKITAFIENVRGIGSAEVDDCFTILLHYPSRPRHVGVQPTSFTAILRSHILSVCSPQLRYVVRGTTGTYVKTGLDVQEQQLKAYTDPADIIKDPAYGVEAETLYGTLENLSVVQGGVEIVRSTWPTAARGNYAELFVNLAEVIREGKEALVKWEESADVIDIIEKAYRSAREGRTVTIADE